MSHGETGTDLEQGLTVLLGQLVQNRPSSGITERPEDVAHRGHDRQVTACLSICVTEGGLP